MGRLSSGSDYQLPPIEGNAERLRMVDSEPRFVATENFTHKQQGTTLLFNSIFERNA
jgi:hypothetical protein